MISIQTLFILQPDSLYNASAIIIYTNNVLFGWFRHGERWKQFRTKVQKPVLQPAIVRQYIHPLEKVTNDFITK